MQNGWLRTPCRAQPTDGLEEGAKNGDGDGVEALDGESDGIVFILGITNVSDNDQFKKTN